VTAPGPGMMTIIVMGSTDLDCDSSTTRPEFVMPI
jgi:hypothetical protein